MGRNHTVGFDCSGMVQAAHAAVGISLPRVSEAQGACGQPVGSMAEALPGDIVCYGYHVGIYIGGGQIIHHQNRRCCKKYLLYTVLRGSRCCLINERIEEIIRRILMYMLSVHAGRGLYATDS